MHGAALKYGLQSLKKLFSVFIFRLLTPTMSVGVGRIFESVCLSVCPLHNSKTNGPKVFFKHGVGDTLEVLLF